MEHINKIVKFTIIEREESITGIVLKYNNELTFINYNPVDYVLDGYIILRNNSVEEFEIENDHIKEIIFNKKKMKNIEKFNLDFQSIFDYFMFNAVIFSIELNNGTYHIGRIIDKTKNEINFNVLNSKAQWVGNININIDDIDIIELDNDYINSLCLIIN